MHILFEGKNTAFWEGGCQPFSMRALSPLWVISLIFFTYWKLWEGDFICICLSCILVWQGDSGTWKKLLRGFPKKVENIRFIFIKFIKFKDSSNSCKNIWTACWIRPNTHLINTYHRAWQQRQEIFISLPQFHITNPNPLQIKKELVGMPPSPSLLQVFTYFGPTSNTE